MIIQTAAVETFSYGHLAYDVFAAIFLAKGVIDVIKFMGFLPERTNGNGLSKQVGRLPVETLKNILKQELRDVMQPVANRLDHAVLSLEKIVTILEERR